MTFCAARTPREHAARVAEIMASLPETDDELFAANDNEPPITGAKAHSWPAMRLNAGEDCEDNRRCLVLLQHLFGLASAPDDNVPSPAGTLKQDGDLGLSALVDEVAANDGGSPGNPGYGVDYCLREGTDLETYDDILRAGASGAYCTILPDGRRGGEHVPNFRVVHAWQEILVDGDIVPVKFRSQGQYRAPGKLRRCADGEWRREPPRWRVVRGGDSIRRAALIVTIATMGCRPPRSALPAILAQQPPQTRSRIDLMPGAYLNGCASRLAMTPSRFLGWPWLSNSRLDKSARRWARNTTPPALSEPR